MIEGWLAHRKSVGTDPSDATLEVVKAQQASREPLGADEILRSKRVETNNSKSLDTLIADIRQRVSRRLFAQSRPRSQIRHQIRRPRFAVDDAC